ncbi:MAG: amino acid-binding protein [Gemmataceae bacterium]
MAQTTKQLTVLLENKPGRLAQVTGALAREKVNLAAVTVADARDHRVLRFVPDDMERAKTALKALNVPFQEHEVVLVEMRNQPGALAQVCEVLAQEHIAIDYAYCSAASRNGKTVGVFKVSNTAKCLRVLAESPGERAKRERHGSKGWTRSGRVPPPVIE